MNWMVNMCRIGYGDSIIFLRMICLDINFKAKKLLPQNIIFYTPNDLLCWYYNQISDFGAMVRYRL